MRALLDIAIVAVLVTTFWSANPTIAKQHFTVSVDPLSLMTIATNLPTEQYDQF